ncbi:MAG: nucleotidyltransferase domain-containing protein [Anaerolineales bacterium]
MPLSPVIKGKRPVLYPAIDLELARRIVLDRLVNFAAKVYLFGSQARGQAGRISDIDIAVLPLEPIPGWIFSEIREALEESNILYPVELVDLSETDERFRKRVFEEGIVWKE